MLMSAYQYGFVNARVRGRKSFMLVKSDYNALLSAENIQAAVRKLEGTNYQPYITQLTMEEFNIAKVEENLTRAFQSEVHRILTNLKDKRAIALFRQLHHDLELKCMITILKSIILDISWEDTSRYIIPYGKVDSSTCKELVDGKNLQNAVRRLGSRLAEEILKITKETTSPAEQALEVEAAIERYSSMRIWESANALGGRNRYCIRLIGIVSDKLNIMTVLRMKKLGLKSDEIHSYLTPNYYRVKAEDLKRAVEATSEKDAIKIFTAGHYVDVISPLVSIYEVKEDLSTVEKALERYHADRCEKTFMKSTFTLGEPLAFLYLRWYEVRDLIAILIGKNFGMPRDRIEQALVLHQPPHPV
jgi:vacuolar-type H+-ATPase subunit C/Vma6